MSRISTIDPHEIFERLTSAGETWADTEAAASALEESRKSVLAQLTLRFTEGSSMALAETKARTLPEYTEHVEKMIEARRQANRARVNYDAAKVFVDLLRSANANRRAELEHLRDVA